MGHGEHRLGAMLERIDELLRRRGLTPKRVQRGISYKLGRATVVRIDPKREFLRVQVGERLEAAAPPELRDSYVQRGWLVVRPDVEELAVRYIDRCVAAGSRRLRPALER